jgi:hypothetical protein
MELEKFSIISAGVALSGLCPQFRERDVGATKSLQDTLAACHGQYIALLEGDDFWTCDDKLQKQTDFLDANPDCAISCHRAGFLDEMGVILGIAA